VIRRGQIASTAPELFLHRPRRGMHWRPLQQVRERQHAFAKLVWSIDAGMQQLLEVCVSLTVRVRTYRELCEPADRTESGFGFISLNDNLAGHGVVEKVRSKKDER